MNHARLLLAVPAALSGMLFIASPVLAAPNPPAPTTPHVAPIVPAAPTSTRVPAQPKPKVVVPAAPKTEARVPAHTTPPPAVPVKPTSTAKPNNPVKPTDPSPAAVKPGVGVPAQVITEPLPPAGPADALPVPSGIPEAPGIRVPKQVPAPLPAHTPKPVVTVPTVPTPVTQAPAPQAPVVPATSQPSPDSGKAVPAPQPAPKGRPTPPQTTIGSVPGIGLTPHLPPIAGKTLPINRPATPGVNSRAPISEFDVTFNYETSPLTLDHVVEALLIVGVPVEKLPMFINATYATLQGESGGNVNAVNKWDSNAWGPIQSDGAPRNSSRGGMQTIPGTFAAYHAAGTSNNIYNQVANIAAAWNYIRDRYGVNLTTGAGLATFLGRGGGGYVGY